MREILFRGQRCDNGEWVQGYYIRADHHWHKHGIHKDWITLGASANGGWFALHNKYAVKAETVGQFTGLTDKNGKKIFEGDILTTLGIRAHIVRFEDGEFVLTGTAIPMRHANKFEIIGNIHDNRELLEV